MAEKGRFYLPAIHRQALPPPPASLNPSEQEEWATLHLELAQLDHILRVQLRSPNDTDWHYGQARNFWRSVQRRRGRDPDSGTRNPVTTGVWQTLCGIRASIQSLKTMSTVRTGSTTYQPRLATASHDIAAVDPCPVYKFEPYATIAPPPNPARGGPTPWPTGPMGPPARPQPVKDHTRLHTFSPSIPNPKSYPINALSGQNAWSTRPCQPNLPPFNTPSHPVFAFFGRDLSKAKLMPEICGGPKLFTIDKRDCTDHGWGPGVRVSVAVLEEVTRAAKEASDRIIR